jgi:GxxExxY protein
MESGSESLKYRDLTRKIIGVFYDAYNELGHGFLESLYEQALAIALSQAAIQVQRQVRVSVWFGGQQIGDFRADLVADGKVLLEPRPDARSIKLLKSNC